MLSSILQFLRWRHIKTFFPMTKKILLAAAGLLVSVNPLLPSVSATGNGWAPAPAAAAWSYNGYTVQQIASSSRIIGPLAIGGAVLTAEAPAACLGDACNALTVSVYRNGVRTQATGIPSSALSADRYAKNGNRLIYAKPTADGVFAVYELSLDTGIETTLFSGVSIPGGSNVDVMADHAGTYFLTADIRFSNADTAFTQRALYVWDPAARAARPAVGPANEEDRRFELLDVRNGVALVTMGFPDGSRQLWLEDSNNIDYDGGRATAVPKTWVDAHGTIQYGRFLPDGGIEFFENFSHETWHPGDAAPTAGGQQVTWYHPASEAVKLDGAYLAWTNAADELYLSDGTTVRDVGVAPGNTFALEGGTLYFHGASYDIAHQSTSDMPFPVTDVHDISLAGVDQAHNVYLSSGSVSLKVGYGTSPAVSDPQHVYWRGADGHVYVAALSANPAYSAQALHTADDPTVYLVTADGIRHAIPNEQVYFSWFPDWSSVKVVSADTLASHPLGRPATFAVGALLKLSGDTRVYALAKDGTLRHIMNAETGYGLFGETWYSRIITVSPETFTAYPLGAPLMSAADGANAF